MKRLLPAPWLSLALWLLWLLLNQSLGLGQILFGAVLALLAPLLLAPLRPRPVKLSRPWVALKLLLWVGVDVLVSNLQVAWQILNARRQPPRSRFVQVPLELRDANGLAALAALSTVVPGSVWSELALDHSVLLLHVFDVDDEAAYIARFKARYEKPLLEIFQ